MKVTLVPVSPVPGGRVPARGVRGRRCRCPAPSGAGTRCQERLTLVLAQACDSPPAPGAAPSPGAAGELSSVPAAWPWGPAGRRCVSPPSEETRVEAAVLDKLGFRGDCHCSLRVLSSVSPRIAPQRERGPSGETEGESPGRDRSQFLKLPFPAKPCLDFPDSGLATSVLCR